jgi:hypothetical protein
MYLVSRSGLKVEEDGYEGDDQGRDNDQGEEGGKDGGEDFSGSLTIVTI